MLVALGLCIVTLIVFFFLLRGIDDGFNISRELQISILVFVIGIPFTTACSFTIPHIIGPSLSAVIPIQWLVTVPIFVSLFFSVYQPLYWSYTPNWSEVAPIGLLDAEDLDSLSHFLTCPSGFSPYLRFLHSEFSAEILYLWQDITDYLRMDDIDDQNRRAMEIKEMYFNSESVRFSSGFTVPASLSITDLQTLKRQVEDVMYSSFKRFKESKWYKEYIVAVVINTGLSEMGLILPSSSPSLSSSISSPSPSSLETNRELKEDSLQEGT